MWKLLQEYMPCWLLLEDSLKVFNRHASSELLKCSATGGSRREVFLGTNFLHNDIHSSLVSSHIWLMLMAEHSQNMITF